jgi:LDH2 family malate/lactate/ureidoglycolate dehydrogenase
MGHFELVIDPDKCVGREMFGVMITRYLASLRGAAVRPGAERVMAPGDREWEEMALREAQGVPVDPDTVRFLGLGQWSR